MSSVLNVPNILTLSRIVVIPVFLLIAFAVHFDPLHTYTGFEIKRAVLLLLFALTAVTDWFDGYLARKWNQSSAFGRFLDPVADKLMVAAVLIVLCQWYTSPFMAIAAVVIISREITVSALREWMAEIGQRGLVAVSWVGKVKTTLQMVAIGAFILGWSPIMPIAHILMGIAVILTLWSMILYLKAAWPQLSK